MKTHEMYVNMIAFDVVMIVFDEMKGVTLLYYIQEGGKGKSEGTSPRFHGYSPNTIQGTLFAEQSFAYRNESSTRQTALIFLHSSLFGIAL